MIISVHMPKTAGSSFSKSLTEYFGAGLLLDYADKPLSKTADERIVAAQEFKRVNAENEFAGVSCIHGHFLPIKYLQLTQLKDLVFVTWLRNPVERALSHYYHWRRLKPGVNMSQIYQRMMRDNWTPERFCLAEELRNIYTQFLDGFPLRMFSFIGVTEYYNDEFDYFAKKFLDQHLTPYRERVGENAGRYTIDPLFRREAEEFHSEDMQLYEMALVHKQKREAERR